MKKSSALILLSGLFIFSVSVFAQPFGGEDDVSYASKLWNAMKSAKLVGSGALMSRPYTGQHPHGAILDTIEISFTFDGNTGPQIIKRNYGGDGVSKDAVTIMYQRSGYDADNNDWYWAKYLPDGRLDKNPKDMQLAGRVAKGAKAGCIACHTAAPGGDFVFINDRYK